MVRFTILQNFFLMDPYNAEKLIGDVVMIGSYYYKNPNGSTYYNSGDGYSKYTPPSKK